MDKIYIKGNKKLKGEVHISGAKNAALPLIASSILVNGKISFSNVPNLADIDSIIQLINKLGAKVKREKDCLEIDGSLISNVQADYDLVRKMRASILVLGPLVARFGHAEVSLPGGCAIGARPVNMHIQGLKSLGADINIKHGYIEAKAKKLIGNNIYFDIPTVTGTENLMMAACLAKGTSELRNSAKEPEIKALADALNLMGAKIQGAGTSVIRIEGVSKLSPADIKIIPDRIETGTFMAAVAATCGDVLIKDCKPEHIRGVISKIEDAGVDIEVGTDSIRVKRREQLKSVDIKTLPYPGFPTDMQAQLMALMTVADNNSIINETIFENRFIHANELLRMGADIKISNGNFAIVKGVKNLQGAKVMASDLRASASLIVAGLMAHGTTTILRPYHIDRGYENIEKKFSLLGADIKRI